MDPDAREGRIVPSANLPETPVSKVEDALITLANLPMVAAAIALLDFLDPAEIARTAGILGIGLIVFAESGLLIGMFLPGDSLLFAAGIFSAANPEIMPIVLLASVCFFAAVTGDAVGYWFGAKTGPALFRRPSSRLFRADHLERARIFYDQHGGKTIILARFVPFVRTFAPVIAGAARMPYRRFAAFNVIGGLVWGVGLPVAGYNLGNLIPDIDRYLLPGILAIILLSVMPIIVGLFRKRRANSR